MYQCWRCELLDTTSSVGCLWQDTVRFRRIFFFFVDAKRQIWLTSNYILRKILRFSQAVASADSVVLEATCTSSENKHKVRHFRKDCVSTLCVEWNCENCKEFADHPSRVTHRVHCLLGLPNETTSSATEPWVSCSSDRPTSLTLSLNKQHVHTRYSYHIHTIFTHDIHWISQQSRTPSR